MLLWRFIKRNALMNHEFRKYLWYAAGEIVLVVIGILIALQIDSWYENRQDQVRLQNYLDNIARTINDDLTRVKGLRSDRATTIFDAYQAILATLDPEDVDTEWYNRALVASANRSLLQAQEVHYLSANAESFRALEASGLIGIMSDAELEFMLHDYYRTVERIARLERDMNTRIANLGVRFRTETTSELPALVRREPLLLFDGEFDADTNATLPMWRRTYWDVLTDSTTFELLRSTINQPLLQEYEHLLSLGEHIVDRIRRLPNHDSSEDKSSQLFDATTGPANPSVVANGRPGYHSYGIFTAPTGSPNFQFQYTHVQIAGDALHVSYDGGSPWVYLYFRAGPIEITVDRESRDFSSFEKITLDLKREPETACASLVLEIKDIEDAERGDLASVPLPLTTDWQTYTVDLSQFVEADLSNLHVAAGFLMLDDACHFSIRSIQYQ